MEGLDLKQVLWPGKGYGPFFETFADPTEPEPVWLGSLMSHKRDASGQLYMRNRYYDPSSGRFTQEDPIGLAGGLNLYGFGGGDPVNYSDPYGLCPWCLTCAAGAISDVAVGYGVSRAIGSSYGGRDVLTGLVAGCAGGVIGQLAATRHLRHLRHVRHSDEGAEAARIAGVAARARNPLSQIQSAAREVGELGLEQGQAMEVLKQSITRMGLEYGDDVSIDGVRYLTAQVRSGDGTIRAVSVAADGKVSNAALREVRNGVYEVVP